MSAEVAQDIWTQLNESAVYRRVSQYALVTRAFDLVGKAKENSNTVKALVDLGNNVAGRALAFSQPVLHKVDQYAQLDARSEKALELLEARASDMYQKLKDLDQKRLQAQTALKQALSAPLDTTITLIDKYVPQEGPPQGVADGQAAEVPALLQQELTSTTKLAVISTKLRKGVATTLKSAKKLSEERIAGVKYATALLQYSSKYVEALHITEVGDSIAHRVEGGKALIEANLQKFNEFVASNENLARIHAAISPIVSTLKTRSQRAVFVSLTALATIFDATQNTARAAWTKTSESLDSSVQTISSAVKVFVAKLDAQTVSHLLELTKTTRWIADLLQTERAQLANGTWSYVQSLKIVAEIQRRVRDVLQRTAGVLPSQLLGTFEIGSKLIEAKSS